MSNSVDVTHGIKIRSGIILYLPIILNIPSLTSENVCKALGWLME